MAFTSPARAGTDQIAEHEKPCGDADPHAQRLGRVEAGNGVDYSI
jgi:hypothetical protein